MSGLRLTSSQRRGLDRQLRATHDAGLYRRTLAILEAADGRPIAVAAPGRPGPGDASPIRGFRPCYGLA
jgi:hypothetical protein